MKQTTFNILIVDDDWEDSELLREFLINLGEYQADRVYSIGEAWQAMQRTPYDALLLDYRLGDGTGLDILRGLPERGFDIPAIMITGQGDERCVVQAMQLGAFDYLVKGTDFFSLLPSIIQRAIRTRQLQLELKYSLDQQQYQAMLLNNVRDAIVVWSPEGAITYWNSAAEALFGASASNCVGYPADERYFNHFDPPITPDDLGREVQRCYPGADGREVWVSSCISTMQDSHDATRTIGYMDVARDITERRQAELSLRDSEARLAQASKLAAIGELSSAIAHHINNPLTTIIAEAQVLLENLQGDDFAHESAEAIEQAGWRIQRAIGQLQKFSQPSYNTYGTLSVNDSINDALLLIGDYIRSSGSALDLQLTPAPTPVCGNAHQLGDLWVNLLMLARNLAEVEACNSIGIRTTSGESVGVEFSVDCRRITPEEITERFDPSRDAPAGQNSSGVELSVCREIIKQHKGTFQIIANPERGVIFQVALPREAEHG